MTTRLPPLPHKSALRRSHPQNPPHSVSYSEGLNLHLEGLDSRSEGLNSRSEGLIPPSQKTGNGRSIVSPEMVVHQELLRRFPVDTRVNPLVNRPASRASEPLVGGFRLVRRERIFAIGHSHWMLGSEQALNAEPVSFTDLRRF